MKIWAKTKQWAEGKFLVVRRDGSVPHWPHFVLGARDPAAPAAIRAYVLEGAKLGFDPEYLDSLNELANDFDAYRFDQGNGDADAPPHRKDNNHVIAAMRGNRTIIDVRPDKGNIKKDGNAA